MSESHGRDLRPSQLTLSVKFSELPEADDAVKFIFSFPQPPLQKLERSVLPGERTRVSWAPPQPDSPSQATGLGQVEETDR